jgi:thymidylate kinase
MFIVFEGLNCCGKTTIINNLDIKFKVMSEIYDLPINKEIYNHSRDEEVEVEVAFTNIRENFQPYITGDIILDRYYYSTGVYQSYELYEEHKSRFIKPDIAFFIDISYETARDRFLKRDIVDVRNIKNIMTDENKFNQMRDVYMKMVNAGDLLYIDGNMPLKDIISAIKNELSKAI